MLERLRIVKENLSIIFSIISLLFWSGFFFFAAIYYPLDLFLLPVYFIWIAFMISSPVWVIWLIILIFKLKVDRRLKIGISIWLGMVISQIPNYYIAEYSDKNWKQAGLLTEQAIENYKKINGLYPKQLSDIPDSLFVFNNELSMRYSKQILYHHNDKNDNGHNYLPDSLNYLMSRNANIFDKFEWNTKSKEWLYIDF